jgi:hypothetical protein
VWGRPSPTHRLGSVSFSVFWFSLFPLPVCGDARGAGDSGPVRVRLAGRVDARGLRGQGHRAAPVRPVPAAVFLYIAGYGPLLCACTSASYIKELRHAEMKRDKTEKTGKVAMPV